MLLPLEWLRDYVDVPVPAAELAARLAVSTCEVERVHRRGIADVDGNLGLFRVGRVVEAGKHPNADRLQLCRVDVGEGEPRQIVCGAWNFGAGATVAVALPGAVLPGADAPLKEAKLRGETSYGMILSERELELSAEHSGILVLDEPHEPGTPLADLFPLGDDVLDVEPTRNRPDLLSVYGIAREVAALYGLELVPMPGRDPARAAAEPVDVRVDDLEGCPRYIGRRFRDVRVGPSPPWLKARLSAAGLRPISNVVDVTNYVMHALGSPLHAFDGAKIRGGIVVRRARPGERVTTLDGQERVLEPTDLVIADHERAVALAAIMGGAETEVTEETTEVLLEAANFEPIGILRTSERLGLRTDGSNRWEKGVDPHLAAPAARLATELLVELTGACWVGEGEGSAELPPRPVVHLRPERTSALLGLDVPAPEQAEILRRLGFELGAGGTVTVPTWRARDVEQEIDLVEEVGRFELDGVPFTLPLRREMFGRLTHEQRLRRRVEDALVGFGLSEAYTPSLVAADPDPAAIRLPAPLSSEHAVLRTTLVPSLVDAVRRNVEVGNEGAALFEVARIYRPGGAKLPDEGWRVAGVLPGGLARAKGVVEALHEAEHVEPRFRPAEAPPPFLHPAQAAATEAGVAGALHPALLEGEWGAFELDLDRLAALVPARVRYVDVISYPAVRQDLAFVVDESVRAGDLVDAAREAAGEELRAMRVFDVYRGDQIAPGKKSLAFRVAFQSAERTLADEDATALRGRIVDALAARFGAELRA